MNYRTANTILRTTTSALTSKRLLINSKNQFNYQSKMNLLTITNSIKDSFVKHELYPDVIREQNFTPKGLLIVSYGKDKDAVLGNTLKVDETQELPKIAFTLNVDNTNDLKISEKDKFTLVLTDPDAPSKTDKKWSEYAHFIATDLKLNPVSASEVNDNVDQLSTNLDFDNATTLIPYQGPGPPPKTGKHRYCFLFFKQGDIEPVAPTDRPNWGTGIPAYGVKDWSQEYQLELLAVNFFYAQNVEQ